MSHERFYILFFLFFSSLLDGFDTNSFFFLAKIRTRRVSDNKFPTQPPIFSTFLPKSSPHRYAHDHLQVPIRKCQLLDLKMGCDLRKLGEERSLVPLSLSPKGHERKE
jgi:hypothetical protein